MAPPLTTHIQLQFSRDRAADIHYPSHHVSQSSLKDIRRVKCPCTNTESCMSVCVRDKSPLCRFTESDAEAGLCQRADITQHNLQQPSQNRHSQDHSAHAHSRKSPSHTHTQTITFTQTHTDAEHTLMLLLIQAHTCSTQSPSTPAEKKIYMHLIHYSTHGWVRISSPIFPLLLSLLCLFLSLCRYQTSKCLHCTAVTLMG